MSDVYGRGTTGGTPKVSMLEPIMANTLNSLGFLEKSLPVAMVERLKATVCLNYLKVPSGIDVPWVLGRAITLEKAPTLVASIFFLSFFLF